MSVNVTIDPFKTKKKEEEEEGVECKCTRDTWPLILLLSGFGVAFLVCLVSVLSLMTFEGVPQVVLSIYLIILSLIGLEAELRRFKFLRSIIYSFVIKYFYFLTNYYVRGAYYIFMGSVLLGDAPLNIICGCVCMGFGGLLIGVHLIVGLPVYTDWQEVQAETEARIRKEADNATQAANNLRSGSTPAHDHSQPPIPNASPGSSEYQPAAVPPPGQFTDINRQPNQYEQSTADREPEVPSARRMAASKDDDLARQYYAQQQQQQPAQYSPRDEPVPQTYGQQQQQPQVYGVQAGPASRRNLVDNPFDAADEYQPPRF